MGRRAVLLLVAVLVAGLGTAMILIYVSGINARAEAGQQLVRVLTATEQIEAGELMSEAQAAGKVATAEVRREDMVDGAMATAGSISDQVALDSIYPGEQIIRQNFGAPGAADTLTIPDNEIAMSVELTDPARVAGFVRPGSQVAIFVSADPKLIAQDGTERTLPQYTELLLDDVQVLGVGQTTVKTQTTTTEGGEQTTEEIPRTILTVAVSQKEAEKLVFADRNGDLTMALLTDQSKIRTGGGVRADDVMPGAFQGVTGP